MNFSVLLLSFFLLWSAQPATKPSQAVWNDWREEGLKGKVQKIVIERAAQNEQDGSINDRVRVKSHEVIFDAQGLRLKQNYFDEQNKISTALTYAIVNGDRVQKSVAPALPARPPIVYTQKRLLDEKGRVSETQSWTGGKMHSRAAYKYDDKDNRIESISYVGEQFNTKLKTIFDDKGNISEQISETFDNSVRHTKFTYEFDAQGNWVKSTLQRALVSGGKTTWMVDAITYRTIIYFR